MIKKKNFIAHYLCYRHSEELMIQIYIQKQFIPKGQSILRHAAEHITAD